MPILYPSKSPIDPTQLRRILPPKLSFKSQIITGLLPIIATIAAFEASRLMGFDLVAFNAIISIVLLMAAVVFTSSRNGTIPGLTSATVASIYLAYIFSPDPSAPFIYPYDASIPLRSIFIISFLYLGLAMVTGYLREQIQQSFVHEQIARALAEEQQYRLETIMEQLPVGVIITDAKTGETLYLNNVGKDLLLSLDSPTDGLFEGEIKRINGSIDSQNSIEQEISFPKQNGQQAHLQVSASPIFDLQAEHVSTVSIFYDVTHQKEVEQRKDDFIGIASHELKTPVTSLKIYMQLLQRHSQVISNTDLSETVTKANTQINKLTRLMSDLLDVSRIQTGEADYSFKSTSLNNLAREAVKVIQPSTHHKITIKGKITKPVMVDREKMTQVISNLINNAIKYSANADKILIHLSQAQDRAIITVQDFGIGIPESQQHKIFQRFYQIKHADGRTYTGLGIGLFICHQIVTDHHGELTVSSEPSHGSTFTIKIPFTQPEARSIP